MDALNSSPALQSLCGLVSFVVRVVLLLCETF